MFLIKREKVLCLVLVINLFYLFDVMHCGIVIKFL